MEGQEREWEDRTPRCMRTVSTRPTNERKTWNRCVAALLPETHKHNAQWRAEPARVERGYTRSWGIKYKPFRLVGALGGGDASRQGRVSAESLSSHPSLVVCPAI